MSNKSIAMIATMGIDIGKNSFNVVGLNQRGAIVMRQKWSRPDRSADCQHAAGPDWHGSVALEKLQLRRAREGAGFHNFGKNR